MKRRPTPSPFLQQLRRFPRRPHDDQVDYYDFRTPLPVGKQRSLLPRMTVLDVVTIVLTACAAMLMFIVTFYAGCLR